MTQRADDGDGGRGEAVPRAAQVTSEEGQARPQAGDPGAPAALEDRRDVPEIVKRLRRRRERYRQRGPVYRTAWVIAGFIVLLGGLAMTVLPGPAVVVIPLGLAMLSLEFAWAQNLLEKALEKGADARERAAATSRRSKVIGGLVAAIVLAGAAIAGAFYVYG